MSRNNRWDIEVWVRRTLRSEVEINRHITGSVEDSLLLEILASHLQEWGFARVKSPVTNKGKTLLMKIKKVKVKAIPFGGPVILQIQFAPIRLFYAWLEWDRQEGTDETGRGRAQPQKMGYAKGSNENIHTRRRKGGKDLYCFWRINT